MPKVFSIEIRADRKTKKVYDLIPQWPKRTKHVVPLLPYLAAEYVRREILERVPKTDEWAAYRASLETARVSGTPKGTASFTVRSNVRHRRVRKVDVPRTVLYVRPRSKLSRPRPEILILQNFSPWTLQTMPFMPKRRDALVISRRVSKNEAERVAKARTKDQPKWRRELDRAGAREVNKDRRLRIPKKVRALPDVAFEALRLEFGLGGVKPKAHWRPSVRRLVTSGIKSIVRRDSRLKRAFTRPDYRGWKKWPPKTRQKVRIGEARNYLPFQRKLGIRIS